MNTSHINLPSKEIQYLHTYMINKSLRFVQLNGQKCTHILKYIEWLNKNHKFDKEYFQIVETLLREYKLSIVHWFRQGFQKRLTIQKNYEILEIIYLVKDMIKQISPICTVRNFGLKYFNQQAYGFSQQKSELIQNKPPSIRLNQRQIMLYKIVYNFKTLTWKLMRKIKQQKLKQLFQGQQKNDQLHQILLVEKSYQEFMNHQFKYLNLFQKKFITENHKKYKESKHQYFNFKKQQQLQQRQTQISINRQAQLRTDCQQQHQQNQPGTKFNNQSLIQSLKNVCQIFQNSEHNMKSTPLSEHKLAQKSSPQTSHMIDLQSVQQFHQFDQFQQNNLQNSEPISQSTQQIQYSIQKKVHVIDNKNEQYSLSDINNFLQYQRQKQLEILQSKRDYQNDHYFNEMNNLKLIKQNKEIKQQHQQTTTSTYEINRNYFVPNHYQMQMQEQQNRTILEQPKVNTIGYISQQLQQTQQINTQRLCCRQYFIRNQIVGPESKDVQYKNYAFPWNINLQIKLGKTICSFLNCNGGNIYVGVNQDSHFQRKVVGHRYTNRDMEEVYKVVREIVQTIKPDIIIEQLYDVKFIPIKNRNKSINYPETFIKDLYVVKISIHQGIFPNIYTMLNRANNTEEAYFRTNNQVLCYKSLWQILAAQRQRITSQYRIQRLYPHQNPCSNNRQKNHSINNGFDLKSCINKQQHQILLNQQFQTPKKHQYQNKNIFPQKPNQEFELMHTQSNKQKSNKNSSTNKKKQLKTSVKLGQLNKQQQQNFDAITKTISNKKNSNMRLSQQNNSTRDPVNLLFNPLQAVNNNLFQVKSSSNRINSSSKNNGKLNTTQNSSVHEFQSRLAVPNLSKNIDQLKGKQQANNYNQKSETSSTKSSVKRSKSKQKQNDGNNMHLQNQTNSSSQLVLQETNSKS